MTLCWVVVGTRGIGGEKAICAMLTVTCLQNIAYATAWVSVDGAAVDYSFGLRRQRTLSMSHARHVYSQAEENRLQMPDSPLQKAFPLVSLMRQVEFGPQNNLSHGATNKQIRVTEVRHVNKWIDQSNHTCTLVQKLYLVALLFPTYFRG